MNIVGHLEEKTMFHKNRQCKVPSLLPWMQCLGNGVMKQRHILDLCLIACGSISYGETVGVRISTSKAF